MIAVLISHFFKVEVDQGGGKGTTASALRRNFCTCYSSSGRSKSETIKQVH